MKYNPQIHHRRSIRLKEYDYVQPGAYFLTICTYNKQCWFGEIRNSQMYLNHLGNIVAQEWLRTPKIRPEIFLDEWIIMPNHLHGIIVLTRATLGGSIAYSSAEMERAQVSQRNRGHLRAEMERTKVGQGNRGHLRAAERAHVGAPPRLVRKGKSLSSIVAGFKSATTKPINILRQTPRIPLWQRNYYESVIRNNHHLEQIRDYIRANPSRWKDDPQFSPLDSINSLDLPF